MSYQNYVIGAYAVFAVVLLWDFVVPRLQIRRELRAAKLRKAREAKRAEPMELSR
jgi:heme exporter protein D